jgi:CBS domain containing-hemolysin-like protein
LPLERARLWVEGAWPTETLTVGEFVAREAGRVPQPSEKLVVWDLPVEIESVEDERIASVIVTPPTLEEELDPADEEKR